MAILKIARMGHPVLLQRADAVADPTAPGVRQLAADMLETMRDAGGTGLAAPQVHVPLRLLMFFVSGGRARREDDAGGARDGDVPPSDVLSSDIPLTVLVNPEIEPLGEDKVLGWEACLSIPELAGEVPRYRAIRYRGLGLDGAVIEREAEGFHARVVQHEYDHLDGILYPQRMADLSRLVFSSEMKHLAAAQGGQGDGASGEETAREGAPRGEARQEESAEATE